MLRLFGGKSRARGGALPTAEAAAVSGGCAPESFPDEIAAVIAAVMAALGPKGGTVIRVQPSCRSAWRQSARQSRFSS